MVVEKNSGSRSERAGNHQSSSALYFSDTARNTDRARGAAGAAPDHWCVPHGETVLQFRGDDRHEELTCKPVGETECRARQSADSQNGRRALGNGCVDVFVPPKPSVDDQT